MLDRSHVIASVLMPLYAQPSHQYWNGWTQAGACRRFGAAIESHASQFAAETAIQSAMASHIYQVCHTLPDAWMQGPTR